MQKNFESIPSKEAIRYEDWVFIATVFAKVVVVVNEDNCAKNTVSVHTCAKQNMGFKFPDKVLLLTRIIYKDGRVDGALNSVGMVPCKLLQFNNKSFSNSHSSNILIHHSLSIRSNWATSVYLIGGENVEVVGTGV